MSDIAIEHEQKEIFTYLQTLVEPTQSTDIVYAISHIKQVNPMALEALFPRLVFHASCAEDIKMIEETLLPVAKQYAPGTTLTILHNFIESQRLLLFKDKNESKTK